jgi:hypothetical protein
MLIWIARLAGIAGVLAMVLAVLVRLSGDYWFAGFQVGTILQAGMAGTLVACLGYTAALVERSKLQ